jgi:hypothetical protein
VADVIQVARLDDLPPGRGPVVTIADKDVALFNVEGRWGRCWWRSSDDPSY